MYLDASKRYVWATYPNPTSKWFWLNKKIKRFNAENMKKCKEETDKGYVFEIDAECTKILQRQHCALLFMPEKMMINKCEKLVCNMYDKENYVITSESKKQALNCRLISKKIHKVIAFNQEPWS